MTTDPAAALTALRAATPLTQCITNYVAMTYAANVLLAAGAAPAMVHCEEESGDFAAIAGALTINIGTVSVPWVAGMTAAIAGAKAAGKPWVLDPVAHFATPWRSGVTADLMALGPTIVRGNASEIIALTGAESAGRGVDSGDTVAAAEDAARALATDTGAVIAVTGETDFVAAPDGRAARLTGGSDLMPRVTVMGCALTCLTGAYAAVCDDPFDAATGALALFKRAGSLAGTRAEGPGSFGWRFLDALAETRPGDLVGILHPV